MTATYGHQARLAIDAASPFDASSYPLEFIRETITERQGKIDTNGIRGERQHAVERTRLGITQVGGQIELNPSPLDLDQLLPWILGVAEAANVFNFDDTPITQDILIDKIGDIFLFSTCYVSKATFRGSVGQPIALILDIVGLSMTPGQSWAGTIPSLGTADGDAPYVFHDGSTLTLGGASQLNAITEFELTIDNVASVRHHMSADATEANWTDLIITLRTNLEWSSGSPDTTALYQQALAGAAGTLTFTDKTGNASCSFAFAALQPEDETPTVQSKAEIPYDLTMIARKSGSTNALIVTSDSDTTV